MSAQNESIGDTNPSFDPQVNAGYVIGSSLIKTTQIEDVWITSELHRPAGP